MKPATKIIVILNLLILLSACGGAGKKEGSFSEEEIGWLAYDDGENFLFQNPDTVGDEITLFVTNVKDPAQLRSYYPIEAEVTLSNPEHGEFFKIYLLKDEHEFKRYIKVGEVYQSFDLIDPIKNLQVGDRTYKNVYVFKNDSMSNGLNEVYYSKEFGIVQYTTQDGKVYQLMNQDQTP